MSVTSAAQDPPAPKSAALREPETFSREYVQELRRESEQWRHKARGHENEAIQAREASEIAKRDSEQAAAQAKLDADTAIGAARRAAEARVLRAELKAAALAAGMVDIDGLKLLDTDGVALSEAGELVVPKNFFAEARKTKPWLFGQTSTSSTSGAPNAEPPRTKSVRDMDDKERRAFEREHGIYR